MSKFYIDDRGVSRWEILKEIGPNLWEYVPHRINGPAIKYPNGIEIWYQNGERHRLDGPAFDAPSGLKEWYQNGKRHRNYGPAVVLSNGFKEWYDRGKSSLRLKYIYYATEITLVLVPLRLPIYVLLWIIEWVIYRKGYRLITHKCSNRCCEFLNEKRLVDMIQKTNDYYRSLNKPKQPNIFKNSTIWQKLTNNILRMLMISN